MAWRLEPATEVFGSSHYNAALRIIIHRNSWSAATFGMISITAPAQEVCLRLLPVRARRV